MNSLNRYVPAGYQTYQGAFERIRQAHRKLIEPVKSSQINKKVDSLSALFDIIPITDGMTLSFHHHLRNGDFVMNMVIAEIKKRNLKNMVLAPSAIFPVHEPLVDLIKKGHVTKIFTNYINGPVADAVSKGYLKDLLIMDTHGGRPRAIESGELTIDVAFIATPCSDMYGNGNGTTGPSACGALGYAIADLYYAKKKVVITDHLVNEVLYKEIDGTYVDYLIEVAQIGDSKGIVSGTTRPTKDPVQLKIAKDTAKLIDELGYIKDGMSFQTGAGGTSLAVAKEVEQRMKQRNIKGSFASGGITHFLVDMLKDGLFERLYDVQCFDLVAVESYKNNPNHHFMSASTYGNPFEDKPIVNDLDIVILGATEIDLDFNVNVTTDSNGLLLGGSGGHADTAAGAKLTIITTNLLKSRISMVKEKVTTVTTPGESIDVLVTERGIAIHPRRRDLIEKLKDSKLNIVMIQDLLELSYQIAGKPNDPLLTKDVIGLVRYRDGSIIDSLYKVKE